MKHYEIAPSILSADFARLGEDASQVIAAGGDRIHFDVMDNHYVPNLTFGPMVCKALRKYGIQAPIDVHLMTTPVDDLCRQFADAGATSITIHPDATIHLDRSINLIRESGCEAGIALNPATPLIHLKHVIDEIDSILIMSVNPGFGGQSFIPYSLEKIREAFHLVKLSKRKIKIAVDGGINSKNIRSLAEAGANYFVAGNAIFSTRNYAETIKTMREELSRATQPV